MENIVFNQYAKFNDDRIWNEKVLPDNNNNTKKNSVRSAWGRVFGSKSVKLQISRAALAVRTHFLKAKLHSHTARQRTSTLTSNMRWHGFTTLCNQFLNGKTWAPTHFRGSRALYPLLFVVARHSQKWRHAGPGDTQSTRTEWRVGRQTDRLHKKQSLTSR